jgi:hypothetical protein
MTAAAAAAGCINGSVTCHVNSSSGSSSICCCHQCCRILHCNALLLLLLWLVKAPAPKVFCFLFSQEVMQMLQTLSA